MIYRFKSAMKPYKIGNNNRMVEKIDNYSRLLIWIHPSLGGSFTRGCLDVGPLYGPNITNERARFYFTEQGFHRFGHYIMSDAKRNGQILVVEKRKNPKRSQIIYRDQWQVAILPNKKGEKDGE